MEFCVNVKSLTHVTRFTLLSAVAFIAAGCGGGDSCQDQISLGSSASCGASDSVTVDFPIFYVKRAVPDPLTTDPSNVLQLREFSAGADLYMRSSASPSALETNITGTMTNQLGDVRDLDVSYDGKKVVFAMRFPIDPDEDDEENQRSTWDIWEYDIPSATLRPLLVDPTPGNDDERRHDRFPHYLPDGRIAFTSSRQRISQAVLLDEGKPQYQAQDENNNESASLLHVMDGNGNNMRQLSFNQSHDMDSAVLPNGQIVFSRWDGASGADAVSLYRMNPDGSGLELLYGRQPCSHVATNGNTSCVAAVGGQLPTPIQFLSPRPLQNGRLMALVRPMTGTDDGGDLVSIDVNNYVENTQPTLANAGVLNGPAQTRVSPIQINTEPDEGSLGGRYRSAYPLADSSNRLLVSWSQCRVIENTTTVPCTAQRIDPTRIPAPVFAPPLYGIYIYNLNNNTQLPIVAPQEGFIYSDVVAGAARTLPPVILDRVAGVDFANELASQSAGVLDIKSVYDFDGSDRAPGGINGVRNPATTTAAQRPARFLRIEKPVSLPDDDIRDVRNTAFSPAGRFMREIIGYAPIEPDGSVRVKVPANVAFQFSIVDANARRITNATAQGFSSPLHRNWLQVQPGETLTCNGCHSPQAANAATQRSHGRQALFAAVNGGAPATGLFPNTDPALQGDTGDTMAQARSRVMCRLSQGFACNPSVDVIYNDVWTDPIPAGRPKDASFDLCYSVGPTDVGADAADTNIKHVCTSRIDTVAPVVPFCEANWASNCRIVINYIQNIQVLWDKPRPSGAADNVCTSCHSPVDVVNANANRVPAGNLDLTNSQSDVQPDHFTSYRKLLFTHNAQELNGTMLRDICVLPRDPVTDACPDNGNDNNAGNDFVTVSAPMNALNARGSRFFNVMSTPGATVDHTTFVTEAEKRLISEWLDIGAQYYNDPFLAPEN